MSKRFGMKALVGLAGAVAVLVGVAWAAGNRVYVRRMMYEQVLTDAAASNGTSIALSDLQPRGAFSIEVRLSGTGTVDYINAEVSIDETTWHYAANVVTNTAVEATYAAPDTSYARLRIPPTPYVRLTGKASADTPRVSAWIIAH